MRWERRESLKSIKYSLLNREVLSDWWLSSGGVPGERCMFFVVCNHVSFAPGGDKVTELDVKLVKSLIFCL